jgi:hypothetical protein
MMQKKPVVTMSAKGPSVSIDGKTRRSQGSPMIKTNDQSKTSSLQKFATAQVVRLNPKPYSPFYQESRLQLPYTPSETRLWENHFSKYDPLVGNAIDLHTRYPLSFLGIHCEDPYVQKFFYDMIDESDLFRTCLDIGKEYWTVGEAIVEGEWDDNRGIWTDYVVHNPDFIDIRTHPLVKKPIISLIPDQSLFQIIHGFTPEDRIQRAQLPREYLEAIQAGRNLVLDNERVYHFVRRERAYDVRGTSILERCFLDLMYRDKLREAQFVIADNYVTPLKIFKIGDPAGQVRPTTEDLMAFREILDEATYDPNFAIIYHGALTVEFQTGAGALFTTSSEFERVEKNILVGLFTSPSVMMGEGPNIQAGVIAMDILQQRYIQFRQEFEHWIEDFLFKRVSKAQKFYKYKNGVRGELIVPRVKWTRINLKNNRDFQQSLIQMAESRIVSRRTLLELFDLDWETEKTFIAEEAKDTLFATRDVTNFIIQAAQNKQISMKTVHETLGVDHKEEMSRIYEETGQAKPAENKVKEAPVGDLSEKAINEISKQVADEVAIGNLDSEDIEEVTQVITENVARSESELLEKKVDEAIKKMLDDGSLTIEEAYGAKGVILEEAKKNHELDM